MACRRDERAVLPPDPGPSAPATGRSWRRRSEQGTEARCTGTAGDVMNTNEEATQGDHQAPADGYAIVVGIDNSPASAAALHWAAQHSRATGLPLRLVHAWQLSATGSEALASGAAYIEAAAADARARATRWVLDTLGGDAALVRWTLQVYQGGAGPVIVALSRGTPLVVV